MSDRASDTDTIWIVAIIFLVIGFIFGCKLDDIQDRLGRIEKAVQGQQKTNHQGGRADGR